MPPSPSVPNSSRWLLDLHQRARDWVQRTAWRQETAHTLEYVDLIFAFALARVGERTEAERLREQAGAELRGGDDAHRTLLAGYSRRIEQALAGQPHTGPLPADWMESLETMDRLMRYMVDRLRVDSRILEPDHRTNPYRHWGARVNDFAREIAELADLTVREVFIGRVRSLRAQIEQPRRHLGANAQVCLLRNALGRASFAGEDFTSELLGETSSLLQRIIPETSNRQSSEVLEWHDLLEVSLEASRTFRCTERFLHLLELVQRLLTANNQNGQHPPHGILDASIRGLLSLNMCDEADSFLNLASQHVFPDGVLPPAIAFTESGTLGRLQMMLHIAGGWYAFGWNSLADPVLCRAREVLFLNTLVPRDQTQLACASVRAVRLAEYAIASAHLNLLLERLERILDTYTTGSHFSISHLDVVESIALSAAEVCRPA